jgi:hypothetical protein
VTSFTRAAKIGISTGKSQKTNSKFQRKLNWNLEFNDLKF